MMPYTRCACCGAELDVIQQVMPKRTLTLVTCQNEACHPDIRWQTLSPDDHRQRCLDLAAECSHQVVAQ